jgi:superfamily I DNA and/or RNA helicase
LVGDHKQLPPTIKSKEAENLNFNRTLLDLLAPQIHHCYLLEEQYRMHDKILNFSNSRYYNGKIHSAVHVANHTVLSDETPLVFIDTAGTGFEEEQIPGEQSHFNSGEYNILREHLLSIFERALGHSIGIITPYAEQVRYIRKEVEGDKKLKSLDISIDSIDGFQGQERDIIYLSLVRSNDQGIVGFLADERRFNVALTRAKKKLVVIGDTATLNIHSAYSQFVEYVEKEGKYMSAWEFMS